MAMLAANRVEDPAYMSYILRKVFICEVYRELQIHYLCHDEAFQDILTRSELEQLMLNNTNTAKLDQLRCIAGKRWTFDDFKAFLTVLGKNNEHIKKAMQKEFDRVRFLEPCYPEPVLQPRSIPMKVIPDHREAPKRTVSRSYSDLDRQMQTTRKEPIPRTYSQPERRGKKRDKTYDMSTSPRGMALVINNEKFTHLHERPGSQKDKENLAKMFKFLGYKVAFMNDKTASEMTYDLQRFAKDKRLQNVSAILIVILTHGMGEGVLFGKNGRVVETGSHIRPLEGTYITKDELRNLFSATSCPLMQDKPKGFILQACRGVNEDIIQSAGTTSSLQSENPLHSPTNPTGQLSGESSGKRVSQTGHFLFAYASSSGYKAYRQPSIGSPFIKRLCDTIMRRGHEDDFEHILKELRRSFNDQLAEGVFMMPEVSGTLLYDWYFEPPM